MVLRRKDGTDYKISGPNPIMKSQSLWDDEVKLHNMTYSDVVTSRTVADVPIPVEECYANADTEPTEAVYPDLQSIAAEEIQVRARPVNISNIEVPKRKILQMPKQLAYCLPAYEQEDPVYGEKKLVYGIKFKIDVLVLYATDVESHLWTAAGGVTVKSIVFLTNDYRWWMVTEMVPKDGGWWIKGVPSSITPSF
jgi:hypothetical protein